MGLTLLTHSSVFLHSLSKLGLKSEDLPVPLLSRLKCLEQLDLSGNSLEEMPQGMCLPSLLKLDLSNNDLEDVTTLESLTSLEELKVEDNLYLTVNIELGFYVCCTWALFCVSNCSMYDEHFFR